MSKMRKFNVPQDTICEFASLIEEYGLTNHIVGTEDDDVIVEVEYDREDREAIFELMELLDEDE